MLRISTRLVLTVLVAVMVAAAVAGSGSAGTTRAKLGPRPGIPRLQASFPGPHRPTLPLLRGRLGPMIRPPFPGERTCFIDAGLCKLHAPRCLVVSPCASNASALPIVASVAILRGQVRPYRLSPPPSPPRR